MEQSGSTIYIHPLTGDMKPTWKYYGMDLEQEGYILFTDFLHLYNINTLTDNRSTHDR